MAVTDEQVAQALVRERIKLFSYLWAILRDPHMVEDVLQELSLLALRKRDQIVDADHLLAWLRTSGRYLALQAIEKSGHQAESMDPEVMVQLDGAWSELDNQSHADALDALRRCLDKLSASSIRLLRLRYTDGVSGIQFAEASGQSLRTCYRNLARTTSQLAKCIDRDLSGDTA